MLVGLLLLVGRGDGHAMQGDKLQASHHQLQAIIHRCEALAPPKTSETDYSALLHKALEETQRAVALVTDHWDDPDTIPLEIAPLCQTILDMAAKFALNQISRIRDGTSTILSQSLFNLASRMPCRGLGQQEFDVDIPDVSALASFGTFLQSLNDWIKPYLTPHFAPFERLHDSMTTLKGFYLQTLRIAVHLAELCASWPQQEALATLHEGLKQITVTLVHYERLSAPGWDEFVFGQHRKRIVLRNNVGLDLLHSSFQPSLDLYVLEQTATDEPPAPPLLPSIRVARENYRKYMFEALQTLERSPLGPANYSDLYELFQSLSLINNLDNIRSSVVPQAPWPDLRRLNGDLRSTILNLFQLLSSTGSRILDSPVPRTPADEHNQHDINAFLKTVERFCDETADDILRNVRLLSLMQKKILTGGELQWTMARLDAPGRSLLYQKFRQLAALYGHYVQARNFLQQINAVGQYGLSVWVERDFVDTVDDMGQLASLMATLLGGAKGLAEQREAQEKRELEDRLHYLDGSRHQAGRIEGMNANGPSGNDTKRQDVLDGIFGRPGRTLNPGDRRPKRQPVGGTWLRRPGGTTAAPPALKKSRLALKMVMVAALLGIGFAAWWFRRHLWGGSTKDDDRDHVSEALPADLPRREPAAAELPSS